jgi:hypothetical protein
MWWCHFWVGKNSISVFSTEKNKNTKQNRTTTSLVGHVVLFTEKFALHSNGQDYSASLTTSKAHLLTEML